jgi:glycosyltransferase involved in cell wall biosynthesis
VTFGPRAYKVQTALFAVRAALYALRKRPDIIFSRDEFALYILSFFTKKIIWEAHTSFYNFAVRRLLKKARVIVTITQALKDFYIEKKGAKAQFCVAPDGVDLEEFVVAESSLECRKRLNLPINKKIVIYTGHLYMWKGVYVLAEAAKLLGDDMLVVFIGGTEKDSKPFRELYGQEHNIVILGKKPYAEMPYYMKAAHVLVLPNSGIEDISRLYTSPIKLFEYMASKNPIVASDLPSIREILDDKNSILVPADNPEALAVGIEHAVTHGPDIQSKVKQAFVDVQQYSWLKRAERILAAGGIFTNTD